MRGITVVFLYIALFIANVSALLCVYRGGWIQCTRSCGGGTRQRLVRCIDMISKKSVEDVHCASQKKPLQQEDCNTNPCQPWTTSSWQQVCAHITDFVQQTYAVFCDYYFVI